MDLIVSVSSIIPTVAILIAVLFISKKKYLNHLIKSAEISLMISALIGLSSLCLLYFNQLQTTVFGINDFGLLFRVDTLSSAMLFMVSIIGFVVVKYSRSYLMGDENHLGFIKRLIITIALVQLLMISGSLVTLVIFWTTTSIALHYLLVFYKERKNARYSARKKFLVARISDIGLIAASILLFVEFQTVNLEIIFDQLQQTEVNTNIVLAGVFIVIAAIFKSAQVPFHGWILEVMEAPTPVSGLLHAGLLNAGPFLIIRFAYLMDMSSVGSTILIVVGGVTALYGTIVFPSQPAIKTALAYSSVAHMGFSLMTCGLGIYSAALLHLMAHSFYKAHSFLSSGSIVEKYRLVRLNKKIQSNVNVFNVLVGLLVTGALYVGLLTLWGGFEGQNLQMYLLGGIIIVGVSVYSIKTLSYDNTLKILLMSIAVSAIVLLSFFTLEHLFDGLIGTQIPEVTNLTATQLSISIVMLSLFIGSVMLSLIEGDGVTNANKWQVYKRNGFYLHHFFDRLVNVNSTKLIKK